MIQRAPRFRPTRDGLDAAGETSHEQADTVMCVAVARWTRSKLRKPRIRGQDPNTVVRSGRLPPFPAMVGGFPCCCHCWDPSDPLELTLFFFQQLQYVTPLRGTKLSRRSDHLKTISRYFLVQFLLANVITSIMQRVRRDKRYIATQPQA
jgi:hypothetical protein